MFTIIRKEVFTPNIKLFEVEAPRIAQKARAGQFIIIIVSENGERVPMTIADFDRDKGTITMVFQEVGKTTMHLGTLKEKDRLVSVIGPLGNPSHIDGLKKVICIGGGVGIPAIFPIARALKDQGTQVISIIGARSKDLLILEDWMESVSDSLVITTDDGTYGRRGVVTEPLKEILEKERDVERVIAVGPAIMMKFVAKATMPFKVKTIVSLNPIMVDATGMCGVCRVEIGGKTRFGCVHGPEFDAHEVDFDLLLSRLSQYKEDEKKAIEHWHKCLEAGRG